MAKVELAPTALLSLAMLSACAPAPAGLTDAQLDDYAAGLKRIPATSPAAEPTKLPVLPTKEAFNPADPRVREIYQPPVPGVFGGGAVEPSATPRPPELSPTIAITLPDGTKATATLPPFTATLVPATLTPTPQAGIREYAPPLVKFTDVLAMPGWSKYPDVIKRLPGNSVQVLTPGTEMRVRNNTDSIEVGDKGFEVKVKMSTVNNNNPAGVISAIILANRAREPLQIEIGFDNNRNLLVHSFDFYNTDRNRRSIHLITDKNNIKLSSDELIIQFTGVGTKERINIYDGAAGKLLVKDLQLPIPFFTEDSNKLYFGFYPQSIWNGPVMTVAAFQAASY